MKFVRRHGGQRRWGIQIGRFMIGVTELPPANEKLAETVAAEASIVIGEMMSVTHLDNDPRMERIQNYFSHCQWRDGREVLPVHLTPWR